MKPELIKKLLQKYLSQFSKKLEEVYNANVKFEICSLGYFQNLEGKLYLHVFVDTEPIERSAKNKKFIKNEIYEFLKEILTVSGVEEIVVELDQRPLYNIEEEKLPFKEKKSKNSRIREFSQDVNTDELKWHVDEEDRMVKSLHKTDWMIQIDNELPKTLSENQEIFIPKGVYHRVIKGNGNLKVKVRFT